MSEFVHDVVAAVLVRDGRALLCHRHPLREWFPDVWDLPGGHVAPDESPADALARELREELGIEISRLPSEPFATFRDGSEMRVQVWVIDRWVGHVSNRAPDEHDDIAWLLASELGGLQVADPRLAEVVTAAIQHTSESAASAGLRRHLTIVLDESEVGEVAALRRHWDPVMAAGVPPHITVVYPEEADNFDDLVERARRVIPGFGPFEVRLGRSTTIDAGVGGVFIEVEDDADAIRSLRDRVLQSPVAPVSLGPHLTIAHPRTSSNGPACWRELEGWSADTPIRVTAVSFTETSTRSGLREVERFLL